MTDEQQKALAEIRRLLTEAYKDYFARTDTYCKSSEGYIEVRYPSFFWQEERGRDGAASGISIYSYVLGPHRMHDFDTFDKALAEVRKWHAEQMAWTPED